MSQVHFLLVLIITVYGLLLIFTVPISFVYGFLECIYCKLKVEVSLRYCIGKVVDR